MRVGEVGLEERSSVEKTTIDAVEDVMMYQENERGKGMWMVVKVIVVRRRR